MVVLRRTDVNGNAKKTTTVNKINDRNKMPTANSGTLLAPTHGRPLRK